MSRIAYPFLTLSEKSVTAGMWMLESDGEALPIGGMLPDWDYARDLRIHRSVNVDREAAARQLGLSSSDMELQLVLRLGTGPGSLPRTIREIQRLSLTDGGSNVVLDAVIDAGGLSQRLLVETAIILRAATANPSRLSPGLAGARLWRDQLDVRLEGEEPRFPMEVTSFSQRFAGRPEVGALWYLHWSPGDLHRDFGGAVRLYLNGDRPRFIERFVSADALTLQVVLADAMAQIIGGTLAQPEIDPVLEECEESSLAGHVRAWLKLAFPGQKAAAVRSMLELRPASFNAAVLAIAEFEDAGVDR